MTKRVHLVWQLDSEKTHFSEHIMLKLYTCGGLVPRGYYTLGLGVLCGLILVCHLSGFWDKTSNQECLS